MAFGSVSRGPDETLQTGILLRLCLPRVGQKEGS
jgi:hypothetical protein